MLLYARDAPIPAGHASLASREVPKLDGSPSAFIALVVILALVIFITGAAVLYLIWDEKLSKNDRSSRVQRYRSSGKDDDGGSPRKPRWIPSLFQWNRSHSSSQATVTKKNSIGGWLRSSEPNPSSDPLSIAEEQPPTGTTTPVNGQMSETSPARLSVISVAETAHKILQPIPISRDRVSSILSERSRTVSFGSTLPSHHDHSSNPRTQHSIPSIVEHLSPPSVMSSPSPSTSPGLLGTPSAEELALIYPNGRGRPFATQSGTSITLERGTRFMEDL
ncbi:hypothetical protein FA15DRAFT_686789 [Coprinopsis marcescibilis]|uniref:Uncharacterized protein n=1 Tax=Coprinopsis marcescibilis TaxID=230819 RepID=A0A5C3KZC6_COPMA|nr:hypothetical protein FA15DRAFT_686789 [Coprinopsis marcescibilis]